MPSDPKNRKPALPEPAKPEAKTTGDESAELEKMALKDVPIGARVLPGTMNDTVFDYSHVLPKDLKLKYALHVHSGQSSASTPALCANLRVGSHAVGHVVGYLRDGGKSIEPHSNLDESHRGKGLGLAMYEALLAHAKNKHGIKELRGGSHTPEAHAVHQKLARKHGMTYRVDKKHPAYEQWGPDWVPDDEHPPYKAILKEEEQPLGKMAKPGPTFPKLGVKDNRRETAVATTPRHMRIHQLSAISATPVSEDEKKKLREHPSSEMGAGSSKTFGGVNSYAVSPTLQRQVWRGSSTVNTLKETGQVQLHEDLHNIFKRVGEKYGIQGRRNLSRNLLHWLSVKDPAAHDELTNYVRNRYPGAREDWHGPEEHWTYLISYLNGPQERKNFHQSKNHDPYREQDFHNHMKRAYRVLQNAAAKLDPTWVLNPTDKQFNDWNALEAKMGKTEEGLEKGAMQRLAPYKPQVDTTGEERHYIKGWQAHADRDSRLRIPRLEGAGRVRALHKLHSKTQVRKNPETGGREFLLHRGAGPESPEDTSRPLTSWTHDPKVAAGFAGHDPNKKTVSSAWIPENQIHHVLDQVGYVDDFATMTMHGGQPKQGQSVKTPQGDFRAIGKPGYAEGEVLVSSKLYAEHPELFQIPDKDLNKSLVPAFLLASFLTSPTAAQQAIWSPKGLHPELAPIAHLESSWGKNMNHQPSPQGEFHTAHGALGFKPITAHEEYLKSPSMQKLYPGLTHPDKFLERFKHDSEFYNLTAGAHWNHLKKILGSPEKAAFGWRWGAGAAKKRTDPEHDLYVIKYKALSRGVQQGQLKKDEQSDDITRLVTSDHLGERMIGLRMATDPKHLDAYLDHASIRGDDSTEALRLFMEKPQNAERLHRLMELNLPDSLIPEILKHPETNDQHLDAAFRPHHNSLAAIVTHPKVRPDQIRRAVDMSRDEKIPLPEVFEYFLKPDIHPEEIASYIEMILDPDEDWWTCMEPILAHHPALPLDVFESLLQGRHPMREHILTRPMSQIEMGRFLADTKLNHGFNTEDTLIALHSQPVISEMNQDRLFHHHDPRVRQALLERPDCSPRISGKAEAAAGKPVFEENLKAWLEPLDLKKMAVKPEDLKMIHRASDPHGHQVVNHRFHMTAHPEAHESTVSDYRQNVLDTPNIIKRTGTAQGTGISRKVVYTLKADTANNKPVRRYMVKPYFTKVAPRLRNWQKFPISGWSEMTNQALYHAAGIGNLHQRAHVSEHPVEVFDDPVKRYEAAHQKWLADNGYQGQNPYSGKAHAAWMDSNERSGGNASFSPITKEPMLVVQLEPEHLTIADSGVHKHGTAEHTKDQARKIAIMDMLTGNLDRHSGNLLIHNNTDNLLAIDHDRSFNYVNNTKLNKPNKDLSGIDDNFNTYLRSPAIAAIVAHPRTPSGSYNPHRPESNPHDADLGYMRDFEPVIEQWWPSVSKQVKAEMQKHLQAIKNPSIREHVARNFERRAAQLDEMAELGTSNYGADWHTTSFPIYRYGTKDHEE